MSFALPICVTQANAKDVENQGALALVQSHQVDCTALHDFDSSVLAVLLAWQRQLGKRNQSLVVLNPPEKLRVLASVYGVSNLLGLQ
jgi:phospholipid transport system transporter-binding protein